MKVIPIQNNHNRNNDKPEFDRELIASLPSSGPRYTSYPTADRFHDGFREAEYINALVKSREEDSSVPFRDFMFKEHAKNLQQEIENYKLSMEDEEEQKHRRHFPR